MEALEGSVNQGKVLVEAWQRQNFNHHEGSFEALLISVVCSVSVRNAQRNRESLARFKTLEHEEKRVSEQFCKNQPFQNGNMAMARHFLDKVRYCIE